MDAESPDERTGATEDTNQSRAELTGSGESAKPTESSEPRNLQTSSFPEHATDDALAHLRRRYADGGVSEAQLERAVERLLAVEDSDDEAVVALRNRYARGDLTDEQFDRKYERLRATSTVENAEESVERSALSEEETRRSDESPREDEDSI